MEFVCNVESCIGGGIGGEGNSSKDEYLTAKLVCVHESLPVIACLTKDSWLLSWNTETGSTLVHEHLASLQQLSHTNVKSSGFKSLHFYERQLDSGAEQQQGEGILVLTESELIVLDLGKSLSLSLGIGRVVNEAPLAIKVHTLSSKKLGITKALNSLAVFAFPHALATGIKKQSYAMLGCR